MEDETKEFARYKTVNEKEVLKEPVKQFINTQIYCCFLCVDEIIQKDCFTQAKTQISDFGWK